MQSWNRRPHRTIIMENRQNMNFQVFFFIEDFFLPSTKLISSITCHRTAVEKAGFKGNRNKKRQKAKNACGFSKQKYKSNFCAWSIWNWKHNGEEIYIGILYCIAQTQVVAFVLNPSIWQKNAILQLFMTIMIMIGSKNSKKLQHNRLVSKDSEY